MALCQVEKLRRCPELGGSLRSTMPSRVQSEIGRLPEDLDSPLLSPHRQRRGSETTLPEATGSSPEGTGLRRHWSPARRTRWTSGGAVNPWSSPGPLAKGVSRGRDRWRLARAVQASPTPSRLYVKDYQEMMLTRLVVARDKAEDAGIGAARPSGDLDSSERGARMARIETVLCRRRRE